MIIHKVLIVEDDEADRAIIKGMLAEAAPEIVLIAAEHGRDGLRLCKTEKPDCVLLDYYLPDMTGEEFLADLRRSEGHIPVPIALLTGREDRAIAGVALSTGAQDYVVKGTMNSHGLVRVIENAIEKYQIRQQLEEQKAALELRNFELEVLRSELENRLVELTEATHTKDQFLAVMSHEMRTPLNAVLGYVDLIMMGIGGEVNAAHRQSLERIRVGAGHLLDLINDVLDLARADASRLELDLRPVDLVAVIEEVTALLESQAVVKGIKLEVDESCRTNVPLVQADLQRVRQVLTNVVGNAIKFTEDGHVRITCAVDKLTERVGVVVEDTGIGIAPEKLPLIFGEFYQADGDLTRTKGGSGLGLAIAQRLVRLMNGEVKVESRIGEGSSFRIMLPIAAEGSERRQEDVERHDARMERHAARTVPSLTDAGTRGTPGTPGTPGRPTPVTVVCYGCDQNALDELARRVGSQVRLLCTSDADRVVELALQENPTLVVLDVSGNDGGAWRAAQRLQEAPELARTAVLLLPGIPAPTTDAPGGIDLGWVALVPKPFTSDQLTSAVSQLVGTSEEGSDLVADVLVVDDDDDSRRVASKFLVAAGAHVREASGGESALVQMRRHAPDVVVLDLMMPVLDGFGVLATMRADPLLAGIPVVVLSAKALSADEREFLGRAAVRVLQKGEHRLGDVAALVIRAATAGKERAEKI